MRVETFRQRVGDAGDADIPGDMPLEFARRQAEIDERARDDSPVMVACQQEWRAPGRMILEHRRNIPAIQE